MPIDVAAGTALFHTADGTAYADLEIGSHRETWAVRSTRFRSWLRRRYYESAGLPLSPDGLAQAINLIEARAQFDSPQHAVHLRIAEHRGTLYVDLADGEWRAIEVWPGGWRVVSRPPVRFRRTPGMLPLPVPEPRGSVDALRSLLNLSHQADFVLVIAWLLATLRPSGPYPVLVITGEQGSAKTVASKMLRGMIDPNVAPVRSLPPNERDLFIAAHNSHLLAFDNVSALSHSTSDALCRLASGGSLSARQLYSDNEEVLLTAARPILLNGIEDAIGRPDLADRTVTIMLNPIDDARRQPEQMVWQAFRAIQPAILGALLTAMSHGLQRLPHTKLDRPPRMADFALWATACETAFWPAGTFAKAYACNRSATAETLLDADPVAVHVRNVMTGREQWSGSASDLLKAFGADRKSTDAARSSASHRIAGIPTSPRALAGRLRRVQPALRAIGIDVIFQRQGRLGRRTITIAARPVRSSAAPRSHIAESRIT